MKVRVTCIIQTLKFQFNSELVIVNIIFFFN